MPQQISPLPIELIDIIFKLAVLPLNGQGEKDHLERQQTGLTLSLTSKACKELVEPLLYRRVTLRHLHQVTRFKDTLATSRAAFVAKYTKALWIVCEEPALHVVDKFLEACGELDHLVLYGEAAQIFQFLPQHLRPYRLRQLTLIDPIGRTHLSYLELSRIHLITSNETNYFQSIIKIIPATSAASFTDICIEVTPDVWEERCISLSVAMLYRLLEVANEQCHVRLKNHRYPSEDRISDSEYIGTWWRRVLENIGSLVPDGMIQGDSLSKRLQISLINDEYPLAFQSSSPTFVDRSILSIDQEPGTLH